MDEWGCGYILRGVGLGVEGRSVFIHRPSMQSMRRMGLFFLRERRLLKAGTVRETRQGEEAWEGWRELWLARG